MSTATHSGPGKEDPSDHSRRPPGRHFLRGLTVLLSLLCLVLAGLWIALPKLAQTLLVPALAQALNAPDLRVDVRRMDFSGLDLGEITLSGEDGQKIRAVLVDWSLSGLLRGRVDAIRIYGLAISVRKNAGRWEVPGLPATRKPPAANSSPAFVPRIDEIYVDARVSLDNDGSRLSLPFSLRGGLDGQARLLLDADTSLAGQSLSLSIHADLRQNDFRLACALPPSSLAALASLLPDDVPPLSGTLRAALDAALPPGGAPRVEGELGLEALRIAFGGMTLSQEGNATARAAWDEGPRLSLSPLSLAAPASLIASVTDITADLDAMAFGCAWDIRLATLPGIDLPAPLRLSGRSRVWSAESGWSMRTEAELDALEARPREIPDLVLALDKSVLRIDAATNAAGATTDGNLTLGRLRLHRKPASATLSGLVLTWKAVQDPKLRGTASISGARLEAGQPGLALAATRLDGQCDFAMDEQIRVNGTINANARANSADAAAWLSLRLPLAWPDPAAKAGSMNLDLNWKGKGLAKISSTIAQDLHGARLDGTLSILPVAVRARMKGRVDIRDISQTRLEFKAGQTLTLPGNLKAFVPALSDLSGSAHLDASARLDMSRGHPKVPVSMNIGALSLTHAESETALHGGNVELAFSNLLDMRSDPDGRLNFDRLQLGTIILEQGDIHFQIEALHSILVEGCRFDWAGGRIGSQAFRINPSVEDYTVELYCDRVQMAQALEQFGMTQAQGGGTANGRIPVHYADGNLSFDNGFLYSTPGEKGVLKIKGTEVLTAGIPPDTPQYGQLDLAAEALKDFSYDWARIRLNTKDRELVVSLELDGKPEKPLPFTYDRDIGGFARVSASSPGSVFQGIRLDVNFRLPLDQLLQYRQLLELMKNGG